MSDKIVPIENKVVQTKWIKTQNAIYDDYVRGEQNWTALAKKHGVKRAEAITAVEQVHDYVKASGAFKEMAKQRLAEMDHHYSMLIKAGWDAVEEMQADARKADKIAPALKAIADIEAKRQDALQKAGMYDDYEMGDLVAEAERKVEEVQKLLKDVISKFPETKTMIINGLRKIQNPDYLPEPTIDGEIIDGQ